MLLYRELDNITKEEDLLIFEKNLKDRFGPVPIETIELIRVVKMRWKAMKLGFEKLTLKNNKMFAYFLNKQKSEYFSSPIFQGSLMFSQKYHSLCKLKEQNGKLYLAIDDVKSIKRADEVLSQIESLIQTPQEANNEN